MDLTTKRWQDAGNLVLGLWLFISPWALDFADTTSSAAWNAYILGAAIVIFAAVAVYMPQAWEEGLNLALGIWLIISPWILKFASDREPTLNAVIVGVLVAVLAAWAMMQDKGFDKWRKDRQHTTAP